MSDEYLTIDEVCNRLSALGAEGSTVGRVFAARLQPQKLEDREKKFVLGVPLPGDRAALVVYRFGLGQARPKASPLDEEGPDWRPRWLSVEGPFTMDEAPAKAKELTSG